MKSRYFRLLFAAPLLAAAAGAVAAPGAQALVMSVQAQGAPQPGPLRDVVTDDAGLFSASDISRIEDAAQQLTSERQRNVRIVTATSFAPLTAEDWAQQAATASGSNAAVLAISTDPSEMGVAVGGDLWTSGEVDAMYTAAFSQLSNGNYADAALDAIDAVSPGGAGIGWAVGGLGVAAVAGGGVWVASRRSTKKSQEQQLADARNIDYSDTDSLGRLPTRTLEELARENLVEADESIRQGRDELKIATAEFGEQRVRPFTSALKTATETLQRAFETHQKLYDAIPETEPEKRAMLIDIISSSAKATEELSSRSTQFNEMRGTLMRAQEEVDRIVQRTIDLRARLEPAQRTLDDLRSRYSDEMLQSIEDNVDIARDSLNESEKLVDQAREVANQPAGRQGSLIDLLSSASHAVEVSDTNLTAIEHAEDNIRDAQTNLPALIAEIEDELREIETLKATREKGARVDVNALDTISSEARTALSNQGDRATTDPLALYTELTDLDARIDAEIDRARGAASDQKRALTVLEQQMQVAVTQIQTAEDLINSRGRIISPQPRTLLAEAKRLFEQAQQNATADTRHAIDAARAATETARRAIAVAKDDIRRYQQQRNQQVGGDIASAILWGSILFGGSGGGNSGGGGSSRGGGGGFSGGGGTPSSRGGMY